MKKVEFLECPICKKIFQKGARTKYCSEVCSARARRIYQAKWKREKFRRLHPDKFNENGKKIKKRRSKASSVMTMLNKEIRKEPRTCLNCGDQYWPITLADANLCPRCKRYMKKMLEPAKVRCSDCGKLSPVDPCYECQAKQRGQQRNGHI